MAEEQKLRYELLSATESQQAIEDGVYVITKESTDDIRRILNDDILLADGEYIPSLGELYFILLHIRDINAALEAIDGKPMDG